MPGHPQIADIRALTTLLLEREVEFILVGGAAALVHGASTGTQDYDIVPARTPTNVERLRAGDGDAAQTVLNSSGTSSPAFPSRHSSNECALSGRSRPT